MQYMENIVLCDRLNAFPVRYPQLLAASYNNNNVATTLVGSSLKPTFPFFYYLRSSQPQHTYN